MRNSAFDFLKNSMQIIVFSFNLKFQNKLGNENDKPCTSNSDCSENECCTFQAVPTLDDTTEIICKYKL